jgi:putative hemolysin
MDWIALLAILFSVILIGFLSGIEVAFISANRLSIELRKKKGTISGKIWSRFSDQPAGFIGSILVGINIMLAIYGLLIGDMLYPVWEWIKKSLNGYVSPDYIDYVKLLIETLLATTIILFAQFIGRAVFKAKNEEIMESNLISRIVKFLHGLFASLSKVFVDMSEWILKYIFNIKVGKKREAFSRLNLEHFLQQNSHVEDEASAKINKELFENALALSEVKIRECLIPRKEIEGVESKTTPDAVKAKFIDTKLSRIVVYENNIDNIIGYVHHLDLFKHPATLKEILHPIPTVPETMSATDLIGKFSKERKSIAWVVDEFGGTAGIVTMEDLLEEIFGEIEDEYDVPQSLIEKQIGPSEYIFSGRIELDHITQKYQLTFEGDENAETLSGFIIQHHESIPRQKERIIIGHYEFDILHVSDTRIETVKLKVLK